MELNRCNGKTEFVFILFKHFIFYISNGGDVSDNVSNDDDDDVVVLDGKVDEGNGDKGD